MACPSLFGGDKGDPEAATEGGDIECFSVWPSIVAGVIQYFIAKFLLDAQKDMRERLSKLAFENLEMAEELFEAHKVLRAWDAQVYEYVKDMECRPRCTKTEERGILAGHNVAANSMQQGAFGHSWHNTGSRSEAINNALSAGMIASGEGYAAAGNHEDLLIEACENLRWTSIATSAAFGEHNPAAPFGAVGDSYINAYNSYGVAANGSIAAFGYTVGSAVDRYTESRRQGNGRQ